MEYFNYYLQEGLRVMLMAIKILSEEEVKNFLDKLTKLEKSNASEDDIY